MKKYYRVYLNECLIGNAIHDNNKHPIICQRSTFTEQFYSEYVFVEIITGKVIYPSTMEYRKELTYELCTKYHSVIPHCEEISSEEVKAWLNNMDKKAIKKYIDNISRIEQKAISAYERKNNTNIKKK